MTRRAVLPKSNTVTGVIGPVRGEHRFWGISVFTAEILEICKFVWSRVSSLIVFFHVAFDWRCQIENEFAQQTFVEAKLHEMVARKFGKLKIS